METQHHPKEFDFSAETLVRHLEFLKWAKKKTKSLWFWHASIHSNTARSPGNKRKEGGPPRLLRSSTPGQWLVLGACHTEPGWLIKTEKLVNSACLDDEVTKEKSVSRPSKKKKDYLVQEVQEKHKRVEEHILPMQRSKADDATSGWLNQVASGLDPTLVANHQENVDRTTKQA